MPRFSASPNPLWLLLFGALAANGCAASPAVRAAEQGRYEGLRETMAADLQQERIGLGDAVSFARAIARGEVARAKGEAGAQRIRAFATCAREIDDALERRAETHDALGAVAALVRLDAGSVSAGSFSRWARGAASGPSAAWRALGTRTLTSSDDAELRRKRIADPDQEVRRSALIASLEASDLEDVEAVLDAVRLDPDPAVQAQALRTAGVLGGERVVLALKDRWPRADEAARERIVEAWSAQGAFRRGGQRELLWAMTSQGGRPAIAAAAMLARAGEDGSVEALGMLERAVRHGSTEDRVRALQKVSLRVPALREAVRQAEGDPDEAVAVAAMVRRLEAPSEVAGVSRGSKPYQELTAKLLKVADSTGPGAPAAKGALARAGDQRLLPLLERDSVAREAKVRIEAGVALAVLGDLRRAAVVAADPEPAVHIQVACAILRAWAAK